MSTDRNFESGMGAGQGDGTDGTGTGTQANEFGMGNQARDTVPTGNEENMGSGRTQGVPVVSKEGNEFGMGNQARDAGSSRNEEGMGAGNAPQAQDASSGNEFGMGSGRPESESGMGVLPGHKSGRNPEHKEGGGFIQKIENVFHKKD